MSECFEMYKMLYNCQLLSLDFSVLLLCSAVSLKSLIYKSLPIDSYSFLKYMGKQTTNNDNFFLPKLISFFITFFFMCWLRLPSQRWTTGVHSCLISKLNRNVYTISRFNTIFDWFGRYLLSNKGSFLFLFLRVTYCSVFKIMNMMFFYLNVFPVCIEIIYLLINIIIFNQTSELAFVLLCFLLWSICNLLKGMDFVSLSLSLHHVAEVWFKQGIYS